MRLDLLGRAGQLQVDHVLQERRVGQVANTRHALANPGIVANGAFAVHDGQRGL